MALKHEVIPAQAGMILSSGKIPNFYNGYPCTSGDDPTIEKVEDADSKLSLHKRG